MQKKKDTKNSYSTDRWTHAAKCYDVEELMNVRAFREFSIEYDPKYDSGNVDMGEFYKFMTKKICQKIDLLERCLDKECEQCET